MKHLTRPIALILCAVLILSAAGCTKPDPQPTDPPAADVYVQARAALDSADAVTLKLQIATHTTVAGEEFSEESSQTLTYQAIGTEDAVIALEEEVEFGVHNKTSFFDIFDSDAINYTETWSKGNVYAELSEAYRFRGPVDAQAAAARYTPVVLLDEALYGSITSSVSDEGTLITFSDPTAAEAWAIPQEGELTEASGTALVSADGVLKKMSYTATYTYGPAQIRLTVASTPRQTPLAVSAPEDPDDYAPISSIDALRMHTSAMSMLSQFDSVSSSSLESTFSQAAGVLLNTSTTTHLDGREADTKAKFETNVFFMDYSTSTQEKNKLEETYQDGEITSVSDGGLPTTTSISWEDIRSYAYLQLMAGMQWMDYWQEVTATDMGSIYLLEYQLNEDFGNTLQNSICEKFWSDPSFLLDRSSGYKSNELTGYLSVDKYTGLPVAAGYYYEGAHTIEGQDYLLTLQYDQSIEAPAKGAYREITDRMPPEEEPENKATPLFYHVTGENGQQMWLLGTIHVGDERTAYLPEEIHEAFTASDALALECNNRLFEKQMEEDDALSEQVSDHYFYSDGVTLESLMEKEDYEQALKLLKATGSYNMNMPYAKPYLWSESIDLFYLRQGYQLHRDQGVEERLCDWAEQENKEILEIESNLFQLQMLTGFSNELQLLLLEESAESTAREYWESTMELYEIWCSGDEEAIRESVSSDVDTQELTPEELAEYEANKHLIDEYDKAVSHNRNADMLKTAIEYLESGKVIFYAVGAAHVMDNTSGLVDALREAGYTVEQVVYQ